MTPGVTLFHNPRCSTSRAAVALLTERGVEPAVVEYLQTGWTKTQLEGLLKQMGGKPRDILRAKEPIAAELGLATASDEAILNAMIAHPTLVERPILVTPMGAAVGRPVENLLPLLKL